MPTFEDVAQMASALPDVTEAEHRGLRRWLVAGKMFAWERPYTKADIKRFGKEAPPDGPLLAVRVEDLHDKEAVLASGIKGVFTMAHFDGYPSVLIQLNKVGKRALKNAMLDAWLAMAPPATAEAYLKKRGPLK